MLRSSCRLLSGRVAVHTARALVRPSTTFACRGDAFGLIYRTFSSSPLNMATRTESDAFGDIEVPADKYWGAQTERSLENFRINQPQDRMPPPIVRAFGILKGAAAKVNIEYGLGTCIRAQWLSC